VIVENFRPGVMDRLGLGYAALQAERPALVYCSITGFGVGAGADLPGYDLLVQALGGLMSITGNPDGEPQKVGVALVAVLHVYFLILEMFLWTKPLGLKTFRNSPEKAADSAILLANILRRLDEDD